MRERCINVHRFKRNIAATIFFFGGKRAHIVQSVAEFDENNADVLVHGEKHFTDVLDVLLFFIPHLQKFNFRDAVHEQCHLIAEHAFDLLQIRLIGAILYRIVEEGGADRIRIQIKAQYNGCHRHGMADIWLTALTELPFMHL